MGTVHHLLVVHADEQIHGRLAQQLGAPPLSATVDPATSGHEALDRIRSTTYDCVVLDMAIARSHIDRLTVLQHIRKLHDASWLPVLIWAPHLDDSIKRELFEQGASDYVLACDEASDELIARVRAHAALSRTTRYAESARELQDRNDRLRADFEDLYEHAVDMYASVDAETAVVIRCNETMARMTGYAKQEIIGKPLYHLYHPDCMSRVREAFETFQRTGSVKNVELVVQCKDGHTMDVLLGVEAHRDENGNIDHSRSTWRDITERRSAQRALLALNEDLENQVRVRTAQLRRTNADLHRFAYAASHDLQEPLRAISGYSQLLTKYYNDRLDDKANTYLANIVGGTERMQALIAGMLAYTRIGSRGGRFHPTACDPVLDKALALLGGAIADSGAEIIRETPLPTIEGDRNQLIQLFYNLIGNALKFRDGRRPRIHVSARHVSSLHSDPSVTLPPISLSDDAWLFSLRDNGIGIRHDYIDRIFEMFGRLHSRDKYSGTGLGLAICKRIVERHDGEIWATSTPGRGSTFFFVLPTRRQHTNQRNREHGEPVRESASRDDAPAT